jgi:DNA-binding NarL/FixJ family response regulator
LEVSGQASTAAEGVELYRSLRPDLVLMDLRLPDQSGAWATVVDICKLPGETPPRAARPSHQCLETIAETHVPDGYHQGLLRARCSSCCV